MMRNKPSRKRESSDEPDKPSKRNLFESVIEELGKSDEELSRLQADGALSSGTSVDLPGDAPTSESKNTVDELVNENAPTSESKNPIDDFKNDAPPSESKNPIDNFMNEVPGDAPPSESKNPIDDFMNEVPGDAPTSDSKNTVDDFMNEVPGDAPTSDSKNTVDDFMNEVPGEAPTSESKNTVDELMNEVPGEAPTSESKNTVDELMNETPGDALASSIVEDGPVALEEPSGPKESPVEKKDTNEELPINESVSKKPIRKPLGEGHTITPHPSYDEFYIAENSYCWRNKLGQYYATRADGEELYPPDYKEKKQYAVKDIDDQLVEEPAKDAYGDYKYFRTESKRMIYPQNRTRKRFILPVDPVSGDEMYSTDPITNELYYPLYFGKEQYARDALGNDIVLIDSKGDAKYAKDQNGNEYYPKRADGHDSYIRSNDIDIPAKSKDGKQIYARKSNRTEFYPRRYFK
jgi:hypothetical protein